MINPMLLVLARAVHLLIQPRGSLVESEEYQVYKDGKQLTLEEVNAEMAHLERMDRQSAIDVRKGMVG